MVDPDPGEVRTPLQCFYPNPSGVKNTAHILYPGPTPDPAGVGVSPKLRETLGLTQIFEFDTTPLPRYRF